VKRRRLRRGAGRSLRPECAHGAPSVRFERDTHVTINVCFRTRKLGGPSHFDDFDLDNPWFYPRH
jgi:hypothetical protein